MVGVGAALGAGEGFLSPLPKSPAKGLLGAGASFFFSGAGAGAGAAGALGLGLALPNFSAGALGLAGAAGAATV